MDKVLLNPSDFEVEECLVQYYMHEAWQEHPGKWFWHCLTCDTGSGRRAKFRRGHQQEGDAKVASKYHRNQKRKNRQGAAWYKWWYKSLMTTTDLELFAALWNQRNGFRHWQDHRRTDVTEEECMRYIQGKFTRAIDMEG